VYSAAEQAHLKNSVPLRQYTRPKQVPPHASKAPPPLAAICPQQHTTSIRNHRQSVRLSLPPSVLVANSVLLLRAACRRRVAEPAHFARRGAFICREQALDTQDRRAEDAFKTSQ
jgi:hypothetical protein